MRKAKRRFKIMLIAFLATKTVKKGLRITYTQSITLVFFEWHLSIQG